jgi:hypothetical protein
MNESTLDLFCNHENENEDLGIDDLFAMALEEEASKLNITVDYYLEEFYL